MAWLHGALSRAETEELITAAGLEDGTFLVRSREGKDDYVLCVVYKSKPTHHLMSKDADGNWTVNKKAFGGYSDIKELIAKLGTKQPGWPVPLTKPVNKSGSGGGGGGSSWLAGPISRAEAEALVGNDDGSFVVRTRVDKADQYVLCVVYKGKPTHHLIVMDEEGNYTVNKKTYGGHKSLEALVTKLGSPTKGWPVPLSSGKAPGGAAPAAAPTFIPVAAAPTPAPVAAAPAPEPEPEPTPAPAVAATPRAAPVKTIEPVSSSSTDDDLTLQLARAVLTLDKKVSAAEGKLSELQALLSRLESA